MDYAQSLEYIHSCQTFGSKKQGLLNITELLGRLGDPQERYPSIHVAGTNGKGSTCAFIDSMLRQGGIDTGLYTSPYLERFNERIRIGGQPIGDGALADVATHVQRAITTMLEDGWVHPTEFEMVTAIGFESFSRAGVRAAVVEVGLGGRLDATNVLREPLVSVITSIGLDHTKILGDTPERIAWEKAGIIKPNVPVVLCPQPESVRRVVRDVCRQQDAPLFDLSEARLNPLGRDLSGQSFSFAYRGHRFERVQISLLGDYQLHNAAAALMAALVARERAGWALDDRALLDGLHAARWPGRLEVVSREPLVLLDGAHNPQGAQALARAIGDYLPDKRRVLLTAAFGDKDWRAMLRTLCTCGFEKIITTRVDYRRAEDPAALASFCGALGADVTAIDSADAALDHALALCPKDGALVIGGSLYLAGALRGRFARLDSGLKT